MKLTHNDYIKMRIENLIEEMSGITADTAKDLSDYQVYKWRGVAHEYYMLTQRVSTRLHPLAKEAYERATLIDESRDY